MPTTSRHRLRRTAVPTLYVIGLAMLVGPIVWLASVNRKMRAFLGGPAGLDAPFADILDTHPAIRPGWAKRIDSDRFAGGLRDGAEIVLPAYVAPSLTPGGAPSSVPEEKVKVELREIGSVAVPSGRIVAWDAFILPPQVRPFSRALPAGWHPVALSIAHVRSRECVALAVVAFSQNKPVKWEMAVPDGEDASTLKEDEMFAFPVDGGTAAFTDSGGPMALDKVTQRDRQFPMRLSSAMKANDYQWATVMLGKRGDPEALNLVAFSSGFGDGRYACYWGLDEAGEPALLVADFAVLE